MRISDWSSDVCSSDLADRRLASIKDHPHGQPGPLQGRWRGDEKHGRFSIDRHLEMTAEAGGIQFDAHFGKRDVDTIDNVSDQRLDEPISTVTQQRSEEHTSELQSLMRSSYAVFCLKKHKVATPRHITT